MPRRNENNRCCVPSPPRAQACECSKMLQKMNKKKALKYESDKGRGDCPSQAAAAAKCRCPARAAGGFGVTVDLSSFFGDERRECWVWVRSQEPVSWLRARLAARLRLTCAPACIALLAPQGLLHPADPLALLSPGDVIRVVPVQFTVLCDDDESRVCRRKLVVHEKCVQSCDEPCPGEDSEPELRLLCDNEPEEEECEDNISSCEKEIPCCKTPVCVTRAVVASPDTRAAACSARLAESPLSAVKQRALDLLNRYELSLASEPAPRSPPSPPRARSPLPAPSPRPARPRRRRVRRRPRRPTAAVSPPTTDDATPDIPQVGALPADAPRDSSVVRNAAARTHARLVHALAV